MSSQPTPDEAIRLLGAAERLGGQVAGSGARESRALVGWGLFAIALLPPFDVIGRDIWGPIFTLAALAGWLATIHYFHARLARVRVRPRGRVGRIWFAWGVWYGGLVVMAELLQAQLGFAWTAAGLGAGLPLLFWGLRLSRQGR